MKVESCSKIKSYFEMSKTYQELLEDIRKKKENENLFDIETFSGDHEVPFPKKLEKVKIFVNGKELLTEQEKKVKAARKRRKRNNQKIKRKTIQKISLST
jgi:Mg2+ and Co2+ transporter CorA